MDSRQAKAIKELLERRTIANTQTKKQAKAWILRDGVHRSDGFLLRETGPLAPPKKAS